MKCIDCGTTIVETDEEKEFEARMLAALELHKAHEAERMAARKVLKPSPVACAQSLTWEAFEKADRSHKKACEKYYAAARQVDELEKK